MVLIFTLLSLIFGICCFVVQPPMILLNNNDNNECLVDDIIYKENRNNIYYTNDFVYLPLNSCINSDFYMLGLFDYIYNMNPNLYGRFLYHVNSGPSTNEYYSFNMWLMEGNDAGFGCSFSSFNVANGTLDIGIYTSGTNLDVRTLSIQTYQNNDYVRSYIFRYYGRNSVQLCIYQVDILYLAQGSNYNGFSCRITEPYFPSLINSSDIDKVLLFCPKGTIPYNAYYSLNDASTEVAYQSGWQKGYERGVQVTNDLWENTIQPDINEGNWNNGYDAGYQDGYTAGYDEGSDIDTTASTIFTGIVNVGLLPVNVFLSMFNYQVFGINISGLVSALLTVSIIIIIFRFIFGKKDD